MENLNLPPFYVGQKVVYITGISMPKNSTHFVSKIVQVECGCWHMAINGLPFNKLPKGHTLTCLECKKGFPQTEENSFYGWDPNSFRPIQEQKYPLIKLTKVIEKEKQLMSAN